jgi:Tfp pilus assembly protein PilV
MRQAFVVVVALALLPARRVHADASADQAEQAVVLMEQLATIIDANKDNCDAMADKLTVFMDKNGEQLRKLKAAGKTVTEQQKKAFSEKYKDRMQAVSAKIMPGMQKCANNPKVSAVMKKATAK